MKIIGLILGYTITACVIVAVGVIVLPLTFIFGLASGGRQS